MQVSPTEQLLPQRPQLLESFIKVIVSTQLPWQDASPAEHPATAGFALGGGETACTGPGFDGVKPAAWPHGERMRQHQFGRCSRVDEEIPRSPNHGKGRNGAQTRADQRADPGIPQPVGIHRQSIHRCGLPGGGMTDQCAQSRASQWQKKNGGAAAGGRIRHSVAVRTLQVTGPANGITSPSGRVSVIDCRCSSPRPPFRCSLSTLPCMKAPGGIATASPTVTGAMT